MVLAKRALCASEHVLSRYSLDRQRKDLLAFFHRLLGSPDNLRSLSETD